MYGVIIEEGPQNWQILQQKDGYASVALSGRVEVEEDVLAHEDAAVIVRVVDENTNARIIEPIYIKPKNQRWETEATIPVGGLYRLETYLRFNGVCERRGDRVFHIGVGDVYLIAGQSNAVGVGKDSVNDPISTDVHMFRLNGNWDIASHPLHDTTDTLYPSAQELTQTGHSPWLNFGKILAKYLGYPIGLIPGTKGGIPLSYWDRTDDGRFFEHSLEMVRASGSDIKGILWYHGCTDVPGEQNRNTYFERFKRVCDDFRTTYGEQIPILTVQLNKAVCLKNKDTNQNGANWSVVREAQRRAMHEIPNVYMVPSIDLMVCDGIHNSSMSNMVIGERVANIALKYLYGKQIVCNAPDIRSAVLESNRSVRMFFNHVYGELFADYNCTDKLMFSVTDDLGRMVPCDYDCPGDDSILLVFERDIKGKAVINCDGYNDHGLMPYDLFSYLPVIPFSGIAVK